MIETLIIRNICQFGRNNKIAMQNSDKLINLFHKYSGDISPFVAALEIAVFLGKEGTPCITE